MKKKLLWVGDAGCPSGFARATHKILDTLRHHFDVTVLGLNYRGDPHGYPYPIWAAAPGGDFLGVGRLPWICHQAEPDVIVLQNDGWQIQHYIQKLRRKLPNGEYMYPQFAAIPVVAAVAVDGKNFRGEWLDGVQHAIFWTRFALGEARDGGYKGSAEVIPLGVDLETYAPMDKYEARLRRGLPKQFDDAFIVGNVNRNQSRKRWDLTIGYFAKWVVDNDIEDAYLFLHCAPTGDVSVDVNQLASYYGILHKMILVELQAHHGVSEQVMRETYNCFDVNATTTQGEGFGLTTIEAMACEVPCIGPRWSALGDWALGAVCAVPCTSTAIGEPYVNVIGGVPDRDQFIRELDELYRDREARAAQGRAGLERAREPRFRWEGIGQAYAKTLAALLGEAHSPTEAEWVDLGRPEEVQV